MELALTKSESQGKPQDEDSAELRRRLLSKTDVTDVGVHKKSRPDDEIQASLY